MATKPLTAREQELVTNHYHVAKRSAATFLRNHRKLDRDEVESDACLALCRAAQHYDPERGEFAPFAAAFIQNRLRDTGRRLALQAGRHVSLEDPANAPALEAAVSCDPDEAVALPSELMAMRRAVDSLSPNVTAVLAGTITGIRDIEMSERLGVSSESVRKIRERGISRLRSRLGVTKRCLDTNIPMRANGISQGTTGAPPGPV